jgi:hypothetical protein
VLKQGQPQEEGRCGTSQLRVLAILPSHLSLGLVTCLASQVPGL